MRPGTQQATHSARRVFTKTAADGGASAKVATIMVTGATSSEWRPSNTRQPCRPVAEPPFADDGRQRLSRPDLATFSASSRHDRGAGAARRPAGRPPGWARPGGRTSCGWRQRAPVDRPRPSVGHTCRTAGPSCSQRTAGRRAASSRTRITARRGARALWVRCRPGRARPLSPCRIPKRTS